MRASFLLSLLLVVGCYHPAPPGGSYLCGAEKVCPDELTCTCGLCVQSEEEAACSFEISATNGARNISVEEHEPFQISIAALTADGTPATKFSGSVSLSSTWGDVCVGTNGCSGHPNQVKLDGGAATAMVQLNRETIAPQSAILRAEFAGNVGSSGKLRINVDSPVFQRDTEPVVAPLTTLPPTSFGFATQLFANASVVKVADGWRMYFDALHVQKVAGKDQTMVGTGVAHSTDGKKFDPPGSALFETPTDGPEAHGFSSAFVNAQGTQLYYAKGPFYLDAGHSRAFGYASVSRYDSVTGEAPFTPALSASVVAGGTGDTSCPFCTSVDTPAVVRDANPALTGGGPDASIMFFSALQPETDAGNTTTYSVTVVRASSPDGKSFVVDPSPLLKSTPDESLLLAPRVIVDGTVYKMFYSLTTAVASDPTAVLDPCSALAPYRVGYATSSDGYFWVRSPRNARKRLNGGPTPVFDVNPVAKAWDSGKSVQVASVVPQDGVDPSSGLVLYYTAYERQITGGCFPNGLGRAVRR